MEQSSMDLYTLFGNPVHHSKSPLIHQLFAKQTHQDLSYTTTLVPLDGFANALNNFHHQGGKGLNVTLPFKQEAFQLLSSLSERAQVAKAVNTIVLNSDGSRFGDNTDGIGLIRDLTQNLKLSLHNKRVLILGAGGAVRGILQPLLAENPHSIVIANRTIEKAAELANEFGNKIKSCGLAKLNESFDLIINGISAGLNREMPALNSQIIQPGATVCYDMIYSHTLTPFLTWSKMHDAAMLADGIGMLVEQAAEAFFIWRGVRPETQPVLTFLKT